MWKRLVVFILITSLFSTSLFCGTTAIEADWVLAARSFTLKDSSNNESEGLKNITSIVPTLILENLADSGVRILSPEEILQRKLVVLYNEKTTLGNTLTTEIKERDKQLFVSSSEKSFEKNLKTMEEKIWETRTKLEEKEGEIAGIKSLLENRSFEDVEEQRERIVLWNNSSDSLFSSDTVKKEDINGLLTGTITASGNYLAVTASLTLYPGEIHAVVVRSLASLADLPSMAQEIANQLKPVLQNKKMVQVAFDIRPVEAKANAKVYVDGEVFSLSRLVDEDILLASGSHSIEVKSTGFKSRTFTADFSDSEKFLATVNLEPVEYTSVVVSSEKLSDNQVYINGIPEGTLGQQMELSTGLAFGTIFPTPLPKNPGEIEGDAADGENVSDEDGEDSQNPYYFVLDIPQEENLLNINLRLKRDTAEISTRIEKRRRAMYNSYSALLISLIPSFVTYGLYVNANNSWALGHSSKDRVDLWKTISTGSMVLSAGLGVNMIIQLGLFIGAADSVLPEKGKIK